MAEFHIVARGTGRYDRARLTSAYVVYSGVERPGSLKVDLVTMTYRLRLYGYEHIPSRPLTLPAVEEYISRAALDPATAEGARVARGVLEELQNLANGIHPPDRAPAMHVPGTRGMYHGMAGTSHLDPGEPFGPIVWLPWYWPVCLPVWLAASLLIGRGIFRRHRRLTAGEVRAGAQASYCPVSQ